MKTITIALLTAAVACFLSACNSRPHPHPRVVLHTAKGDVLVELYTDKAPQTATAFLRFVENGIYNSATFYRVLSADNQPMGTDASELIQGGVWKSKSLTPAPDSVPHESTLQTGLSHTNGTLSLARLEAGSGSTEFFICIGNQTGFDYGGPNAPDGLGYAAFGRVVEGMDVVLQIYKQPETNQYFDKPILINSAVVVR
ncbi:MAG: peptidylprolyl isomerase [Bacteroidetes bacterium]|nr:MAG: peptidylprolyl isomerase [Bacteroidota bacterium]